MKATHIHLLTGRRCYIIKRNGEACTIIFEDETETFQSIITGEVMLKRQIVSINNLKEL